MINKLAKHFLSWAFIIIISVSFVAYFGITGDPLSNQAGVIGTVNGIEIRNSRDSEFTENYQLFMETYRKQGIKENEQLSQYVAQQALRQTVLNQLVYEKAKENYIEVSDKAKLTFILNRYFKNNLEEFKEYQKSGDVTVQNQIEKKTTKNLTRLFFEQTMFSSVPSSKKELDLILKVTSLEKKVVIATINLKLVLEKGVSEQVLRDYYQKNINRYVRKSLQDQEALDLAQDNSLLLFDTSNQVSANNSTDSQNNENFDEVKELVLSDYRIENEDLIIEETRNAIDFKFQTLKQTANNDLLGRFKAKAEELGMDVEVSDYYGYESRSINKLVGKEAIISSPDLIKKTFLLDPNEISELYNTGDSFLILAVIDEKETGKKSNFLEKRYNEDLKEKAKNRIANAFYGELYEEAEIVMAGQGQAQ